MTDPQDTPRLGHRLPGIELIAADGSTTNLDQVRRGRSAIVHFMRSSSCPVCLAHLAAMQRMREAGELGDAEIIMVAPGGQAEAEDAARRAVSRSTHAQIWASESGHQRLGMVKGAVLQHSGTIVLDADGVVRSARLSALPTASFSASEVRNVMAVMAEPVTG